MQALLMLAVLGVVAAGENIGFSESCGAPFGMFPFHVDKFTGIWYAVSQHSTHRIDDDMHCLKLNYTLRRTEKASKLRMYAEWGRNEKRKVELRTQELWWGPNIDSAVSHSVWRKPNDLKWGEAGQHSVIATDYTRYAIVEACNMVYYETDDIFKRIQLTVILSRTPEMDTGSRKILESVASSIVYASGFKEVNHSNCRK